MEAAKAAQDRLARVLALTSDCDTTQLRLSGAEGYLLSRIDGVTPWRHLREMGGLPATEVDACLARWLEQGILEVVGGGGAGGATNAEADANADRPVREDGEPAPEAPRARTPAPIDESALDDRLEIGIPIQRRILEFEAGLGQPYHELLGIEPGAEPRVVKRAYFKLSKEFHPDRYFRREIGPYEERLERIFKKILEAHEILSDPDLRQVENHPAEDGAADAPGAGAASAAEAPPPPVAAEAASAAAGTAPPTAEASSGPGDGGTPVGAAPRRLTKLERLRQRMPFKIDHAAMAARRAKAEEIFKAAEASQRAGRLPEADANIRIAISFDPTRSEFKEALGSIRIQMAGARAAKLLEAPSEHMSDGDMRAALDLLEDVLIYRPHDPELNERAARICLRLGKLASAQEYAETCIDRCPEVAAHHTLLGRIHREQGDLDAARHEFETALKHDAGDVGARRALAAVRIGHRDAVRGGAS